MLIGAIVVISLIFIGFALLILWPIFKERSEKKTFLKSFYTEVYQLAIDKDFYVINNVVLEIDTKFIHFNHILFGNKYIYCICDSYFEGPLSGKFSDQQWFLYKQLGKDHIKNPLLLHKARLSYLSSAIRAEELLVGICVVNDSCIIDQIPDIPDNLAVINRVEFKEFINKKEKENVAPINSIQLDSLVQQIYQKNIQSRDKEKELALK